MSEGPLAPEERARSRGASRGSSKEMRQEGFQRVRERSAVLEEETFEGDFGLQR